MAIGGFIEDGFMAVLFELYRLTGNLGLAIIALTLIIRFALLPLSLHALRSQKKIQDLKPELDKLKKQHAGDKTKLNQSQIELYKKYNINPVSGCLPYLVQIALLIILYRVLLAFLALPEMNGVVIDPKFLWLDLRQSDALHILPVLAGATQFVLSLMIAPGAEHRDIVPNNSTVKKVQQQNKQEEDIADMAMTMQKQMIFILPVMTAVFAWQFQSGLALYWVATTVFSIVQQYYVTGLGGLKSYYQRLVAKISPAK